MAVNTRGLTILCTYVRRAKKKKRKKKDLISKKKEKKAKIKFLSNKTIEPVVLVRGGEGVFRDGVKLRDPLIQRTIPRNWTRWLKKTKMRTGGQAKRIKKTVCTNYSKYTSRKHDISSNITL